MKSPEVQRQSQLLFRICCVLVAMLSFVILWLVRPGTKTELLPFVSGSLVVIDGSVRHPGVYEIGANPMADTVIKMAVSELELSAAEWQRLQAIPLANGDRLTVVERSGGAVVVKGVMSVSERLLMHVPLDINSMTMNDFEQLPGVGAVLAQRIVEYRHKNGGIMAVNDLKRVEGVGDKKFELLVKYFK